MTGRIVILNGAPRSGKSSIAAAMQQSLPGRWINLGVDAQNRMLPPSLLPGIGLRPGGERPDLEPSVVALFSALYDSIAAHADQGFDVVADLGHHDVYSTPLGILPACARRMTGYGVLFQRNVTVLAPDGATADWLATACSILPLPRCKQLVKKFRAQLLITQWKANKVTYVMTKGMRALVRK